MSYSAPEILIDEPYGKQVDLFSIGVITYLMVSGSLPFDDKKDESEIARKTVYEEPPYKGTIWTRLSPEVKDFVAKLLIKDQKKRMTIKEALVHPWMKKFYGKLVEKRLTQNDKDSGSQFKAYSTADE